jgi:acyl-coenzyme A synthetase/AMP-(fatty) acid ligase
MREEKEGHRLRGGLQKGEYSWSRLQSEYPETLPRVDIDPNDVAVIQYTGGTTDKPKGVIA